MTNYEQPADGTEGYPVPFDQDPLRRLRVTYIGRMLRVLDRTGYRAQAVHVLQPANFRTRHFRKEQLIDFPARPEQTWVNGEHLAGWIVPRAIQAVSPRGEYGRASILLTADSRCAYGGPPSAWMPTESGLYIPHDWLVPLAQAPPNVNLPIVEQTLLQLMPAEYRQYPAMLLDSPQAPPYNSK